MKTFSRKFFVPAALIALAMPYSAAFADGGWYVGGSLGQAYLELDVDDEEGDVFAFDEGDTAWKVFGGYVWDLPLIDLGVEGGYVDLASPEASFSDFDAELDPSGLNLWGVAGFDIGPVGLFGKLGVIDWEIDGRTTGSINRPFDESGTDSAFGVGAKFMLWSLEFRAEYETYDIEGTKDVEMISVGASWVF